MVGRLVTYSER